MREMMDDKIQGNSVESVVVDGVEKFSSKVQLGKLIRVTPGKKHGWYESNVGVIRKPLQ